MHYDYQFKITFGLNERFDVEYIKRLCRQHASSNILIEVQNTKGITSDMIKQLGPNVAIRIAGGYDDARKSRYGKDFILRSYYYEEAVIYSKYETIRLLEKMEEIEKGMNSNWSDYQKLLYIYDYLKRSIMYDPKYERKSSSEIRSLRGLITNQTVCAGYAMILKEFMDRANIDCEYVEGTVDKNSGHAWNIINIGGKKYPIDLTWDNTNFRAGKSNTFDWLGRDISKFSECHTPFPGEKTQNYKHTLSQLDSKLIRQLYSQMGLGRAKDYATTTYTGERKDGSRYIVAQVGDSVINNEVYFRYFFVEIDKNGRQQQPLLLYSKTNVTHFIDCKHFGRYIPPMYEEAIDNILFSKENIKDSLDKRTYYIGAINKSSNKNKVELVTSYKEMEKPKNVCDMFIYPTRIFTRSDGSKFVAQQMLKKPFKVCGVDVMRYDIFEIVKENGRHVLKRNTVYTEYNFLMDNRLGVANDFLSRSRLDRKVNEAGGYIGYYSDKEVRTYNPDLVEYFNTSKRIDIDPGKKTNSTPKIPTFDEMKELVTKYEIYIDSNDMFNNKIEIRNIKTGAIQSDPELVRSATFANIWLAAAGVKIYGNEERNGIKYAFNDPARELYDTICKEMLKDCKEKGVIDTVDLYKRISNLSIYKYSENIVMGLFRTPYQTELINNLFMESLNMSPNKKPEPLYSVGYISEILNGFNI